MLLRQGSIRGGRPQEVGHLKDLTLSQLKPEREGYLTKQGQKVKSWKKRYFVLQGQTLYYFTSKKPDAKVTGTIALVASSVLPDTLTRKKFAFQVLIASFLVFRFSRVACSSNFTKNSLDTCCWTYIFVGSAF